MNFCVWMIDWSSVVLSVDFKIVFVCYGWGLLLVVFMIIGFKEVGGFVKFVMVFF